MVAVRGHGADPDASKNAIHLIAPYASYTGGYSPICLNDSWQNLSMITLYGIQKSQTPSSPTHAWLTDHGIDYTFHDFKKQGVPEAQLDNWLQAVGWETLVNARARHAGAAWTMLPKPPWWTPPVPRTGADPRQRHQAPSGGVGRRQSDGGFQARGLCRTVSLIPVRQWRPSHFGGALHNWLILFVAGLFWWPGRLA